MKRFISSPFSFLGLFAGLVLLLTIPVIVLLSRERQDIRGKAAEPSPTIPLSIGSGNGFISGYVYYDDNRNGEHDPGEKSYVKATVRIKQIKQEGTVDDPAKVGNLTTDLATDANGYFRFRLSQLNTGSYSVKVILPDGYKTINTNPLILSDIPANNQSIIEFGLFGLEPTVAVKGAQTTICVARPACLEGTTPCLIPEPTAGWCGTKTAFPKAATKPITISPTLTPEQR